MAPAGTKKTSALSASSSTGGGLYSGGSKLNNSSVNNNRKGGKKLGQQSSVMFGSRLSGSSLRGGNTATQTNAAANGKSIRVLINGRDLTPLSLLDENESLEIKTGARNQDSEKSGVNIFASSSGNASGSIFSSSTGSTGSKKKGAELDSSSDNEEEDEKVETSRERKKREEEDEERAKQARLRRTREQDQEKQASNPAIPAENQLDLQEEIVVLLKETPTKTLLSITGVCVGLETPQHRQVTEENTAYEEMCAAREGSDLYTCRPCQTLNFELKNAEVATVVPPVQDAGCQVTSWDIYDNDTERAKAKAEAAEEEALEDAAEEEEEEEEEAELEENLKSGRSGRTGPLDSTRKPAADERNAPVPPVASGGPGSNSSSKVAAGNSLAVALADVRERQVEKMVATSAVMPGCLLSVEDKKTKDADLARAKAAEEEAEILQDSYLVHLLQTVERGIQQNVFHSKHLFYRAVPFADDDYNHKRAAELTESEESTGAAEQAAGGEADSKAASEEAKTAEKLSADHAESKDLVSSGADLAGELSADSLVGESEAPELQLLWKFQCEEAAGRTVSCMSWNQSNQDLLAVSYCQFQFADQRDGLILFWTLKNPEYPERIYKCDVGVCSIDFSARHPSLLAAGMYDGTVAIYDVHRPDNKPVLDSRRLTTQHKDAVWQVKWVTKSDGNEVLVSVSTDGRVTEWSLKKGLESTDLMVLKRVHVPPELGGSGEGIISRTAAGLTLDFPSNDAGIYYTGTEDGTVHRCSCSYNEQYLETYFAHSAPVYKLRCSPFWPEAFLTCSADWSVRMWEPENDQPLFNFQSVDLADVVNDICWSTSSPTVFGSVAGDGRIEIWDLSRSTLDPVITRFIEGSDRTEAHSASVAVAGNGKPAAANSPAIPPVPPAQPKSAFYSSIAFAYNAPVVVAGSAQGSIDVFRLRGLNSAFDNVEEAQTLLRKIVEENQKH